MQLEQLTIQLINMQMILVAKAQQKAIQDPSADNFLVTNDHIDNLYKLNEVASNLLDVGMLSSEKMEAAAFKSNLMFTEDI